MCNEKKSSYIPAFARPIIMAIAAFSLFAATDAAPEQAKVILKPRDDIFVLPRPETTPIRNLARKRFRPAVPKHSVFPMQKPEIQLYTGVTRTNVSEYISKLLPETPLVSSRQADIWIPDPLPEDHIPHNYIHRTSLREEMVDFEDLDNGKYRALVSRNQRDVQRVRGFVYIPAVWGQQLRIPDQSKRAVNHLVEAVKRFTEIEAGIDRHLMLDSQRLFKTPFIYITTEEAFELTATERENLGRYLRNGGFLLADNSLAQFDYGAGEASLRQMFRDALGCHARFEPIPANHPIYHCYFDFDGPPKGAEPYVEAPYTAGYCGGMTAKIFVMQELPFLEGIFLDGRLVAVYSDRGYTRRWIDYNFSNNIPQFKFGVNLVVYALTREGGSTERNMEHFKDVQ